MSSPGDNNPGQFSLNARGDVARSSNNANANNAGFQSMMQLQSQPPIQKAGSSGSENQRLVISRQESGLQAIDENNPLVEPEDELSNNPALKSFSSSQGLSQAGTPTNADANQKNKNSSSSVNS